MDEPNCYDIIIVGGGIAGISAIEQINIEAPDASILLLTAGSYVKVATTKLKLTANVEELDIHEQSVQDIQLKYPNVTVKNCELSKLVSSRHMVQDADGIYHHYKKLGLCTGAIPKLFVKNHPLVIGLRDMDSAVQLRDRLSKSRRVCVVGNGGIASELVHIIENIQIVWVVRDKYISSNFVDVGAAEFLMNEIREGSKNEESKPAKMLRYTVSKKPNTFGDLSGCALGPNWNQGLDLKSDVKNANKCVNIEFQCEVEEVLAEKPQSETEDWPVYVKLSNKKIYGCDFIISATGVSPVVPLSDVPFAMGGDGGILVNDAMETNIPDVFAAGDVCCVNWDVPFHWFQMRLWSQARPMGFYAGRCMVYSLLGQPKPLVDFSFEMFTHVTRFFGFKVVLLGLFNGQKMDDYEALVRVTKGVEYLKVIVRNGRVHGAVLVGDTDMEETIENLILNQLDVSSYGEDLLNPDIDVEDYFD